MIITILVFMLILGLVVFVHELGHFIAAKKSGVKVEEFAFGFKPRIWGFKRGETEYAINAIPLGGYVKMLGEDEKDKDPRSYSEKPKWKKLIILLAGVAMNFIACWLIFVVLYIVGFEPIFLPEMGKSHLVTATQPVTITSVEKKSPAELVGIKKGDIIKTIAGKDAKTFTDTTIVIYDYLGKPMNIVIQRGSQTLDVIATPRKNPPEGQGPLGVGLTSGNIKTKWYYSPWVALQQTGNMSKMSIEAFGGFVKKLFIKQEVSQDVTGLVGMGVATGIVRRLGFSYIMQFVGLICASLAIINIVPIVPMDGGQVLILGIEAVRKKKITDAQVQWMSMIGLGFILLLFVVVTYHDIITFDIWGKIKGLF